MYAISASPVYGNVTSISSDSPAPSESMGLDVSMAVALPLWMALTWTVQLFAVALPLLVTLPVTCRNGAAGLLRLSVNCKLVLTRLGVPVIWLF